MSCDGELRFPPGGRKKKPRDPSFATLAAIFGMIMVGLLTLAMVFVLVRSDKEEDSDSAGVSMI